jgi:hypothetical protein
VNLAAQIEGAEAQLLVLNQRTAKLKEAHTAAQEVLARWRALRTCGALL